MSAPLPASSDGHAELAVAWVLHGLEPDEDAVFAAHLGDCPGCLRIVAETEEVTTLLRQLKLPIDERGRRRAASRAEWFSQIDKPLEVHDILGA